MLLQVPVRHCWDYVVRIAHCSGARTDDNDITAQHRLATHLHKGLGANDIR